MHSPLIRHMHSLLQVHSFLTIHFAYPVMDIQTELTLSLGAQFDLKLQNSTKLALLTNSPRFQEMK
jgi:hypothetical protein